MRIVRAGLTGGVLAMTVAVGIPAAHAQLLGDVQHFFDGMTPNGSMRQAYEAGRHDEYAALQARRDLWCAPPSNTQAYNVPPPPAPTQPYGYGYGPYANR